MTTFRLILGVVGNGPVLVGQFFVLGLQKEPTRGWIRVADGRGNLTFYSLNSFVTSIVTWWIIFLRT